MRTFLGIVAILGYLVANQGFVPITAPVGSDSGVQGGAGTCDMGTCGCGAQEGMGCCCGGGACDLPSGGIPVRAMRTDARADAGNDSFALERRLVVTFGSGPAILRCRGQQNQHWIYLAAPIFLRPAAVRVVSPPGCEEWSRWSPASVPAIAMIDVPTPPPRA